MGAFCSFGHAHPLAPRFMQSMLPWHGPSISGSSIGLIFLLSAASRYGTKRFATHKILITGYATLALCNLLLIANVFARHLQVLLFALCVLIATLSHGPCNLGGISAFNRVTRANNRTG